MKMFELRRQLTIFYQLEANKSWCHLQETRAGAEVGAPEFSDTSVPHTALEKSPTCSSHTLQFGNWGDTCSVYSHHCIIPEHSALFPDPFHLHGDNHPWKCWKTGEKSGELGLWHVAFLVIQGRQWPMSMQFSPFSQLSDLWHMWVNRDLIKHRSSPSCGLGHKRGFLGSRSAASSHSIFLCCLTEKEPALSFQNIRVQSQPFPKEKMQTKAKTGLIKQRVKQGNWESTW